MTSPRISRASSAPLMRGMLSSASDQVDRHAVKFGDRRLAASRRRDAIARIHQPPRHHAEVRLVRFDHENARPSSASGGGAANFHRAQH